MEDLQKLYCQALWENQFLQHKIVETHKHWEIKNISLTHKLTLYEVGFGTISDIIKRQSTPYQLGNSVRLSQDVKECQEGLHKINQVLIQIESMVNDKRKKKSKISTFDDCNKIQPSLKLVDADAQNSQLISSSRSTNKNQSQPVQEKGLTIENCSLNPFQNYYNSQSDRAKSQAPVLIVSKCIKNSKNETIVTSSKTCQLQILNPACESDQNSETSDNNSDLSSTNCLLQFLRKQSANGFKSNSMQTWTVPEPSIFKTLQDDETDDDVKSVITNINQSHQPGITSKLSKRKSFSIDSILASKCPSQNSEDVQLIQKQLIDSSFCKETDMQTSNDICIL